MTGEANTPANVSAERKNLPANARTLIANARRDITIPYFTDVLRPTDATLLERSGAKGLALYDEVERDTHAWSVLQKRKKTLLSREWRVEAGGGDQIDLDAAEFCESVLKALPFDRICEDLLDATLKGFAICETVWTRDGRFIVPSEIIAHDQRRFVFDEAWKPRLLTWQNMRDGEELPERKFIVHRHGVKGNNPYGLGLGTRLFWAVLFKREGIAFWLTFLEKFAAPTVIGKSPAGLLDDEQRRLLQSLQEIVSSSAVTVPIGTDVDLLEAQRAGNTSYHEWASYWDNQISVCTLGETLTTELKGGGSRAAAETHRDILQMLVDADADLLSDTLRATLLRWLIDYNFPGAKVPSVWRLLPTNEKLQAEAREQQAAATAKEDAALRAIVATSARMPDDDAARAYILAMAPRPLDEEVTDALVANRAAFAAAGPAAPGDAADPDDPAGSKKNT
ncbi:MAG: DUF935 family protein [Hyphomicrobiales bacterium]|nr:DUF935 family protein [Hyphomicrobiales bacterium]